MCGIAGYWDEEAQTGSDRQGLIQNMTERLSHRGPDRRGQWLDERSGIALGHSRLSILDLSPAGDQPMESPSTRYVMVLNGEIYNHCDLRSEIEEKGAVQWRGQSDTETFITGVELLGLERMLKVSVGMFALAIWDRRDQVLTFARDRLGEKPFYYGIQGKTLLFGSELKAFRGHPSFQGVVDRSAVDGYMRFGYVMAPECIYSGISKLLPGHSVSVRLENSRLRIGPLEPYWEVSAPDPNAWASEGLDEQGAVDCLESLVRRAVELQQISDVPLGAFLSGGIDSSVVVALMQSMNSRPIKTFTIGFEEEEYDEAQHAKAVSEILGTDQTCLYVRPKDSLDLISCLVDVYDEPLGDSSAIPTLLVSRLAREQVTVSLSGDGGDELLGGYTWYTEEASRWERVERIPASVRGLAGSSLRGGLECLDAALRRMVGGRYSRSELLPLIRRYAALSGRASESSFEGFYHRGRWVYPSADRLSLGGRRLSRSLLKDPVSNTIDPTEYMMRFDARYYLPDDILVKVDRASMAWSLESRAPLLDHRVAEFAARIPQSLKIKNGVGKWILRQVLYRYVPQELVDRPKKGFGVPLASWLRGALKEWAGDLLNQNRIRQDGYLEPSEVARIWDEHQAGICNHEYVLWTIVGFQAFLHRRDS